MTEENQKTKNFSLSAFAIVVIGIICAVLIFGVGFVLGRMSARKAKNSDNQIIKRDGE